MIQRINQFTNDFNFLCASKRDFNLTVSRYSRKIKILDESKPRTSFYSNTRINFKVFHIAKELKKELEKSISFVNSYMATKDYEYSICNDYLGDFCAKEVVNVDLNSAYLTVLHRDGFISDELYNKINDVDKKSRLVLIGLLAYEPEIWEFKGGERTNIKREGNPFRNFFFYCVQQVSDCMKETYNLIRNDFIFSWVDGIYFICDGFLKDLSVELIKKRGFCCSVETCKDFVFEKKERFVNISFFSEDGTKKIFNVKTDFEKRKIKKNRLYLDYICNPNQTNLINYLDA